MDEERVKWQVVAGVAAVALVVFVGFRMLDGRDPEGPPVRIDGAEEAGVVSGGRAPGGRGSGEGRVYVHVAGEVRRPGLFVLGDGARIAAAIARAGGPTPRAELAGVNLAQRVIDGQQVVVPRVGTVAVGAPATTTSAGAGEVEAPISLASATVEQLEELDGIGPTLAERILEFRDESGGVRSIEQLQEVDGIGEERLADLKEALVP